MLFYLALAFAAQAGLADATVPLVAWAFVALRIVHSAIQCGYNKVMHRFYAHAAGAVVLWALWLLLAVRLLLR